MAGFDSFFSGVANVGQDIKNWGKGMGNDIATCCSNLAGTVGAAVSSSWSGDVVGINAAKVPDMIDAIEQYINTINTHLEKVKTDLNPEMALRGEYVDAVKLYIQTACDVCYKIITQLRYFQDQLVSVRDAYTKKIDTMASAIKDNATEMNSSWDEYKRQKQA